MCPSRPRSENWDLRPELRHRLIRARYPQGTMACHSPDDLGFQRCDQWQGVRYQRHYLATLGEEMFPHPARARTKASPATIPTATRNPCRQTTSLPLARLYTRRARPVPCDGERYPTAVRPSGHVSPTLFRRFQTSVIALTGTPSWRRTHRGRHGTRLLTRPAGDLVDAAQQ